MRIYLLFFFIFLSTKGFAKTDEKLSLVFIGDSLSAGYGVETDESYPSLLESYWKKEGKKIENSNASISGSTSASGVSRLKWQLNNKPDWFFISLGANDGLRGIPTEETYKNLKAMIELSLKKNVKDILAGMKLPPNYGKEYTEKFEKVFSKLSKEYELAFIPFLLEKVAGKKELNIEDGIHPNRKGHQIIFKNLKKPLEDILWPSK